LVALLFESDVRVMSMYCYSYLLILIILLEKQDGIAAAYKIIYKGPGMLRQFHRLNYVY